MCYRSFRLILWNYWLESFMTKDKKNMQAWLAEVLQIQVFVKFLKWNKESVLPYELRNDFMWMRKVIDIYSFTRIQNGFKIMTVKFMPYFEGENCEISQERYSPNQMLCIVCIEFKHWVKEWSINKWSWPSGEYNSHGIDTPVQRNS